MVLRSNVGADALRSFGQDLMNVADELEAPPKPGDTTHCSAPLFRAGGSNYSFIPAVGPVAYITR